MIAALNLACLLLTATANAPIPAMPSTIVTIFEDAELKEARQACQAGDYQRAIAILKAYVVKKPKSFDGYTLLGICHLHLGQNDEAITALEKATQLVPKNELAQFELGQTYLAAQKYEGAIKQYRWLEKNDKQMADEFRLCIPEDIAQQNQLPLSLLYQDQFDLESAKPVFAEKERPDLKPTILHRERPKYSNEALKYHIQGKVVLSVVYNKTGKLLILSVTKGLPGGLTLASIEAARKIRFTPALKDGQPVSIRGTIEFGYALY